MMANPRANAIGRPDHRDTSFAKRVNTGRDIGARAARAAAARPALPSRAFRDESLRSSAIV
jgi:hypothetical protein